MAFHYVCTWDEAKKLTGQHNRFCVENCGCREKKEGGCTRSRMDLCLMFRGDVQTSSDSNKKEITRVEVDEILREAKEKHLVTRPFRNDKDRTVTEGICFCCDDCCGYFLDPTEVCDKGIFIEKTGWDKCTHCGICADVCHFKARIMNEGKLSVDQNNCYGCGLCLEVCPEDCISMASRR
ncbi:MAG TPA: 4Fe-4S binding protein [candidate division Zixibacteria bacterium]